MPKARVYKDFIFIFYKILISIESHSLSVKHAQEKQSQELTTLSWLLKYIVENRYTVAWCRGIPKNALHAVFPNTFFFLKWCGNVKEKWLISHSYPWYRFKDAIFPVSFKESTGLSWVGEMDAVEAVEPSQVVDPAASDPNGVDVTSWVSVCPRGLCVVHKTLTHSGRQQKDSDSGEGDKMMLFRICSRGVN